MGARFSGIILAGLLVSQLLGTLQVFISNRAIVRAMSALHDRGLLTVPNETLFAGLQEPGPAFFGGLFFTFTIGAALTILTLALTQAARPVRGIARHFLCGGFLFLMIFCLFGVNKNGFNPLGSAYFIILPALTAVLARLLLTTEDPPRSPWNILAPAAFFLFTLPFLASAAGPDFFHQVRDRWLLAHPWGRAINDAYYRCTLHAAESVKSFDQKLIRTYRFDGNREGKDAFLLRRTLNGKDIFSLSASEVDLVVHAEGHVLYLGVPGKRVLATDIAAFLAGGPAWLERFSDRADRWKFFRRATFFAMVLLYPAILFFLVYAIVCPMLPARLGPRQRPLIASGISFVLITGGAFLLIPGREAPVPLEEIPAMLKSERPERQARALRTLCGHGSDVSSFPTLKESPSPAVRYWFARCLEKSPSAEATGLLLGLMEDSQVTVATTAMEVLARRKDRAAIPAILDKLAGSRHWYVQWYAYRALRRLGWCQSG